jgi:hypothetical protein
MTNQRLLANIFSAIQELCAGAPGDSIVFWTAFDKERRPVFAVAVAHSPEGVRKLRTRLGGSANEGGSYVPSPLSEN